jgi:hypothetical protein
MDTLPLQFHQGLLFVELGSSERWLLDTGAPTSFGRSSCVSIAGRPFNLGSDYLGFTAESLSQFIGLPCAGLLGGDILNCFDHIFDANNGQLIVASDELQHHGTIVPLELCYQIPIVTARIGSSSYRMFLDTGAELSYLQDESLQAFPSAGRFTDFYPFYGHFETDTHLLPVTLGDSVFTLRCGTLPAPLRNLFTNTGTQGVIGNAVFADRTVGYFPRRRMLVF